MAARYEANVEHNKPSLRSDVKLSRGSASVSFQPKLSFYSVSGTNESDHYYGGTLDLCMYY